MKLYILTLILSQFALSLALADEKLEQATEAKKFLMEACLNNQSLEVSADANGDISLKQQKGDVNFTISYKDIRGSVELATDAAKAAENDKIRECMMPYIGKIINAMLPESEINTKPISLLEKQWLLSKMPLLILDGKPVLYIDNIVQEVKTKAVYAHVEIKNRPDQHLHLYNKDAVDQFEYLNTIYQIRLDDVEIENQRAQLSIVKIKDI